MVGINNAWVNLAQARIDIPRRQEGPIKANSFQSFFREVFFKMGEAFKCLHPSRLVGFFKARQIQHVVNKRDREEQSSSTNRTATDRTASLGRINFDPKYQTETANF